MSKGKSIDRYDEFEQYLRAAEPGPKERAELWQTAIGLQKVDGLEVSDFLVETAKRHIEGEVNIDGVDRLIKTYYQSEAAREVPEDVKEADEVSKNIVRELSTDAFVFSVAGLSGIHRRIFHGVMKHAGVNSDNMISPKRNGSLMEHQCSMVPTKTLPELSNMTWSKSGSSAIKDCRKSR